MLSKLYFKLLTRKTFLMKGEDLPSILLAPIILPFELSPSVTFSPLILVMLHNNELSPVIYLQQALFKKPFSILH
jgi:hypothetical protein